LILEPLKQIRNAAIEKLQPTLFRLQLIDWEIAKVAKDLTPSALAVVLSEWAPGKPLYALRHLG
jgi:hypothetical protein